MKLNKSELYTVKALGQVNKWWNGQAFKATEISKALAVTGEIAEGLLLGRKPGEMQVDAYIKPNLLPDAKGATKALEDMQARELQRLGRQVVDAVVKAGTETLLLCKYIRDNAVSPKLVSHELRQLGFSKSWASKVNRVAQCSNEDWSAFEARTMTFKDILALREGGDAVISSLAAEMGTDVVDIKAQVAELETEDEENPDLIQPTAKEAKEARKKQNERAFATLIKNFKAEKAFRKVDIKLDGFRFVISRVKDEASAEAPAGKKIIC